MNKFVFLGPPGVGKGTLAEVFLKNLHLEHISTGDILRAEIASNSKIGVEAQKYIKDGNLVPDEIVTKMISKKLSREQIQTNGFILDGFPRNVNQAKLLNKELTKLNLKLDAVISLEAQDQLLIERLTARRICPQCKAVYNVIFQKPKQENICDKCNTKLYQRADDNTTTAQNRLKIYKEQTKPLIEYYNNLGILIPVDGSKEKIQIFKEMTQTDGILAN